MHLPKLLINLILGVTLVLSLPGCASRTAYSQAQQPDEGWKHPVAVIFRNLYLGLGGEPVLGAAISEPFQRSEISGCQYFEKALMCYNLAAQSSERVYLEGVGKEILGAAGGQASEYAVYEPFKAVYQEVFKGEMHAGKALTGLRYDSRRQRLVQYFEKIGFSLDLTNPKAAVQLLPYGTTLYRRDNPSSVLPAGSSITAIMDIEIPSAAGLLRLGGPQTLGRPLSLAYAVKDAVWEQLFENALVYIPKDAPATVRLRDLPQRLALTSTPPGPQIYSLKENMLFYQTRDALGYHVPVHFDQFITSHGGVESAGQPISEPMALETAGKHIARQCFQNYCLDYDPSLAEGMNVRMAPIGQAYLDRIDPSALPFVISEKTVAINTSEAHPRLSSAQEQVIEVQVVRAKGGQPLADMEITLTLQLRPEMPSYSLPPTNSSGKTHLTLPPLQGASNAQIILYDACLALPTAQTVCTQNSFMIWNIK